jgi:hypothetical protein
MEEDKSSEQNEHIQDAGEPDQESATQEQAQETATQQPIVVGSAEGIKGATVVTRRRFNKKTLLILLVALLLIGGGAAAYFLVIKKDKATDANSQPANAQTTEPAGKPVSFAPRFDDIRAVVSYDGATWYAATGAVIKVSAGAEPAFYSNAQGLPAGSPNSFAVHNDQLWVATLNGLAVYDKAANKFTAFKDGLSKELVNGQIYYDTTAKKMYVNDFEGFYAYNDQTKKLEAINGPKNVRSFAANDKFIALNSSIGPDWPIWTLNKATGAWSKNTPALEQQSYTVLTLSGKVVVLGRTAGYTSCANAGTVTATSAFMLNDAGTWQPFTAFNADKARPEINVLASAKGAPSKVRTFVCEGNQSKIYTLTLNGTELTLTDEKIVTNSGLLVDDQEQKTHISELIKATKLHAATRVLDVDGAGNVVYAYSDEYSGSSSPMYTGIAVAKQNVLSDATQLDLTAQANYVNVPVLCGVGKDRKLTYVVSGSENITFGGMEGFPDGMWSSVKLHSVEGTKLTEIKDLGKDASTLAFSCTDKELVWLGNTGLNRMNRETKAIEKVGAAVGTDLRYTNTTVSVTPTGNVWFATTSEKPNASTLYYYDVAKAAYTKVAGSLSLTRIQTSTDTHMVAFASAGKTPSTSVYDQMGKVLQTITTVGYYRSPVTHIGKTDEFLALLNGSDNVYTPFTFAKIKVGAPQAAATPQNNAYTARYTSSDGNGFGLIIYEDLVFDAARNQVWLSDDQFGVNALPLQ